MSQREHAVLFTVFGISDGRGEDELRALLKEDNYPYDDGFTWLEEVWSDGDTTFYAGQYDYTEERMDEYQDYMGDFFTEMEDIYRDKETFLSAFSFRSPIWPKDLNIGDVIRFETTDLNGNPVSSEELFAESEVTMVNLWGTWCGPCKRELPELAVMAKEFEAQGCRVIGICNDAYAEDKLEKAKGLLQDAGAEYPWADDVHSGSVSLPFEAVLEKAGSAEIWLYRYNSDHIQNYQELLSEYRGYQQLQSFADRNVYGCNVEKSLFYEETPFRPDWLLRDFIQIIHPNIPHKAPLRYYQKLNE